MKNIATLFVLAVLLLTPFASSAFSVAPALIEISGRRGEVVETEIALINTSTAEKKFYLSTLKFEPREESGVPNFIPYEVDHDGFPEWISLPISPLVVPAKTKLDVPVSVVIPNDTASGGYYAAVTFSDAPYDIVSTGGATVSAKTAVLLLLTVQGETQEKVALLDLTSPEKGKIVDLAEGQFTYRLQNQGNVHVTPTGHITVKDLFGRIIAVGDANPDNSRMLPGSTRTFKGSFGHKTDSFLSLLKEQWAQSALGPLTATLELNYGSGSQTINSSFTFWLVPWQLLLTVIVTVSAVVLITRRFKQKKMRHHRFCSNLK